MNSTKNIKRLSLCLVFIFLCSAGFAAPLYSTEWGFSVDLPEGYELVESNGLDSFSFVNLYGANFDIGVYHAADGRSEHFQSTQALVQGVRRRLNSSGDADSFIYRGNLTFVMELRFTLPGERTPFSGWAIAAELETADTSAPRPVFLAMAYGPAAQGELLDFHLSALNSIALKDNDRLAPGPITEFLYPRLTQIRVPVFGMGFEAAIFAEDAEAAQALIDREFHLLTRYVNAPNWQEAWQRFYRAIYRDSFYRLADIAAGMRRRLGASDEDSRDFAERLLAWVQSFHYERDLEGSDFVNLVSAATEGRGDCDSRAMLWALILRTADIPSGIIVSRHYSHAMGLADVGGYGARFLVEGRNFLVAETTAPVDIGLIAEDKSGIEHWLSIVFE